MRDVVLALWIDSVRLLLAGYLLPAAWSKLRHRAHFQLGLAAYHLLPAWAIRPISIVLPITELLLGIGLLSGVGLALASYATALLLMVFIVAVTINLRRGREIACACTGVADDQRISWGLVARNTLLVGAAAWLGWNSAASLTWMVSRETWASTLLLISHTPSLVVLVFTTLSMVVTLRLIESSVALSKSIA